jgi:hypothetical protein
MAAYLAALPGLSAALAFSADSFGRVPPVSGDLSADRAAAIVIASAGGVAGSTF